MGNMGFYSKLQSKIRYTPWLGRFLLHIIPDWYWYVSVKPVGKFLIRLSRNRNYWLRPALRLEGFMMGTIERLIAPGAIVYDLGANIGLYSRFFVQKFHASKVYAFEPMSDNCPQLTRNLEIGGCADKVEVLPFAVGEEDGIVDFQVDDVSSNSGRLDAITQGEPSPSRVQYGLRPKIETVTVHRLDTLFSQGRLLPPDLIKVDVEGAEAMALRGARQLLLQHRPGLIIELHGAEETIGVLQILWECNYFCYAYLKVGDGRVYKRLNVEDLPAITEKYSVFFIAASCNEDLLTLPIEDPEWIKN
jgi:FkbM family methyltransferase